MTEASGGSSGKDLFIVDNSVSGWTGLRYLEEWTEIARAFDIATGYFEIGALLALDGNWQGLEKIRILMGADMTTRTRAVLLEAVTKTALKVLDESLESEKKENPFLRGVPSILDALTSRQIECRVYDKDKFHAKAYITHAKLEIVGSQALVGSSNFTSPGLTQNIELNIQVQSAREVAQLQEWFEHHWEEGTEVTDTVINAVERQVHQYTPFDIYAKSLYEFFKGHELTSSEWDETRSQMFPKLDRYQKEAYWSLMKISQQHGGAFLCDGVGLGKTFVGLMLIERLVLHEGKRVVLFAPKAAKDAVWEPHLRKWLSHIGGGSDFSNLAVFSHTDLGRKGEFPERFRRITELADAVIVDEAHHFRNPGKLGDEEAGVEASRYYKLFDLLDESERRKRLFMLTATPINNRLSDFRHMIELFSRKDESYFGKTLGVNNLRAHFNNLEKSLRTTVGSETVDLSEHLPEAEEVLSADDIFRELVVQRSRAYARESQIRETGKAAMFPKRRAPQVAEYSIRKTYGRLLEIFEAAFTEKNLFTLPIYYPLAWYKGDDETVDPFEENRQKQVVGLIRTQFLKRFESSVAAFELSCNRMLGKLLAFLEKHSETPAEIKRLERWKSQNEETLGVSTQWQLDFWGVEGWDEVPDEDIVTPEMLDAVEHLSRNEYDVTEMMQEAFLDCDQLVSFLEESRKFKPENDDKLKKLIRLIKSKEVAGEKILIFTEFADTARYLMTHLVDAGIEGVEQVDSGTKRNRADVIQRFAPYYNGSSSPELEAEDRSEIKVLISTDVLSEGLNLQDASRMVNYDIHWNPVRLMQRIGRVDRRMDPEVEERLVADHPDIEQSRGKISFWNFLPPAELNAILSLYSKVTQKTLLISKTLGIEGKKLLTPDDDFEALKEFNQSYEGSKTIVEDMHLEYQKLVAEDPNLESRLKAFPGAIFSGRKRAAKGFGGAFFCYSLPALDRELGQFTHEVGHTRWYFLARDQNEIFEEPQSIISSIRSTPKTALSRQFEDSELIEMRAKVEKHIKNTYLKRVDAPLGVRPELKSWMELNEGKTNGD